MREFPLSIAVTESDLRVAAEVAVDVRSDAARKHGPVEAARCDALRFVRGIAVGAGAGTVFWIAFGLSARVAWGWIAGG